MFDKMWINFYWYGFSCFWLLNLLIKETVESVDLVVAGLFALTSWGGVVATLISEFLK